MRDKYRVISYIIYTFVQYRRILWHERRSCSSCHIHFARLIQPRVIFPDSANCDMLFLACVSSEILTEMTRHYSYRCLSFTYTHTHTHTYTHKHTDTHKHTHTHKHTYTHTLQVFLLFHVQSPYCNFKITKG